MLPRAHLFDELVLNMAINELSWIPARPKKSMRRTSMVSVWRCDIPNRLTDAPQARGVVVRQGKVGWDWLYCYDRINRSSSISSDQQIEEKSGSP